MAIEFLETLSTDGHPPMVQQFEIPELVQAQNAEIPSCGVTSAHRPGAEGRYLLWL